MALWTCDAYQSGQVDVVGSIGTPSGVWGSTSWIPKVMATTVGWKLAT